MILKPAAWFNKKDFKVKIHDILLFPRIKDRKGPVIALALQYITGPLDSWPRMSLSGKPFKFIKTYKGYLFSALVSSRALPDFKGDLHYFNDIVIPSDILTLDRGAYLVSTDKKRESFAIRFNETSEHILSELRNRCLDKIKNNNGTISLDKYDKNRPYFINLCNLTGNPKDSIGAPEREVFKYFSDLYI